MCICACFYMWNLFSVVVLHGSMIDWRGVSTCHVYMYMLLYVKLIWCSGVAWIYDQLRGGSICHVYICMLLYVKLIWCSGIYGSMIDWQGVSICHAYMCMLLYVKLIQCSGVAWIYDQLRGGGPSAMHIFDFCYMWNWFGEVVLHGSMINWRVHLPWVYLHSAICETYLV